MIIRRPWQDLAISGCIVLALASVIAATTVLVKKKAEANQSKASRTYAARPVQDLPHAFSQVKGLEISSMSLENQGTPEAAFVINVTNNRDVAVMAIDFVSGKDTYSGLSQDGLLDEDNPQIIIPPHSLGTFTWYLGGIIEGEGIKLAAAIFSDGKEEGDSSFVAGIKLARQDYQKRRRDAKLKNGGAQ